MTEPSRRVVGPGTRVLVMVIALLLAGCVGGSESSSGDDDRPSVTPTTEVVETPTAETAPPVADADFVAAAVAALDASIAEGDGPEDTIAYDLIDSAVGEDGFVTLTICSWTGDTVFDTVRDSLYRTSVTADGEVSASHVTSPVAPGECINTEMIESALDFIDEFDVYWSEVIGDPETFASDERSSVLLEDALFARAAESTEVWTRDGVHYLSTELPGDLRVALEADLLFRRRRSGNFELLELALCRPMRPDYGVFRDGVLFDDERSDDAPGDQSIALYQLVSDPEAELGWRIFGDEGLIWGDCFETGDWPGAVNVWMSNEVPFVVAER